MPEIASGHRRPYSEVLVIGLDVGSTTVKAVVVEPGQQVVIYRNYRRHEARQTELCLEFLEQIEKELSPHAEAGFRIAVTGSGGNEIAERLGAPFVQEVSAISLAVTRLYPEVRSVVELGGQDAKIIIFKEDPATGRKKTYPSMNDKCAGGTGSVIDRISARLNVPPGDVATMRYEGVRLHPVAGKCGVFAETDINSLVKQGIPTDQLVASLFESIVQQNLSVLTRGHTLMPQVLLLGGPNHYIRGLVECWRHNIPLLWKERKVTLPAGQSIRELIVVPENAHYFAALGAAETAEEEANDDPSFGIYHGCKVLRSSLARDEGAARLRTGLSPLCQSEEEQARFEEQYRPPPWEPVRFEAGTRVEAYLGLDGGSTSTKAVLLDPRMRVLAKAYQLSRGNPIQDAKEMFASLESQILEQDCTLEILGLGTTGYAKDILKDVFRADVALVETVAHTQAGLHYFSGSDVIIDVGGQDIKLIFLKNDAVHDFKLNTQCSAGNGYFLQGTAEALGFRVEDYADIAFSARAMPEFGYGCAVFMQTDIVDFQRQGWSAEEIMAGLAAVLPKNIWLYVAKISNLPKLGRKFILQGGTQHNLAAVKAQVDFISSRFVGSGVEPEVIVHPHCGVSGAIGCALEVHRLHEEQGQETRFIGLAAAQDIGYHAIRGEETRCGFCKNKCLRTFIDLSGGERIIIATCEKGSVEELADMKRIKKGLDAAKRANPNLAEISAREVFRPVEVLQSRSGPVERRRAALPFVKGRAARRAERVERRERVRIGMPRVMNLYSMAPVFMGYFQSLGVAAENLVWSDYSSEELYRGGAKRGSIDPCFPSKLGIPHLHNLMEKKHTADRPLSHIFFPMIDTLPTVLVGTIANRACPTVCNTPEAVGAAFIKEGDLFAEQGIVFKKTFCNIDNPLLLARQLFLDWKDEIGVTEEESRFAVRQGLAALEAFEAARRAESRKIIDRLEREGGIGLVLLARPYHNDPGINHEICAEFPKLGYPVLTQSSLPLDEDLLLRLFGDEIDRGEVAHPMDIGEVWKNSYSENSSRKIWAARFVARHPNLVALELSNFKCGHDAPIYSLVEEIIGRSGTPYFSFKDIDENRPAGSIKIRVETIAYFLERYHQKLKQELATRRAIALHLEKLQRELRGGGHGTNANSSGFPSRG